MPTGYTASVQDGTITSLRDFALLCARNFGATIMMRGDPLSATIPDRFYPSDFYEKRVQKARVELATLRAMSPIDAQRAMQQEHAQRLARWKERTWEGAIQKVRYLNMLELVHSSTAPTAEHAGLWEFMGKQLEDSITHDCDLGAYLPMPRLPRWPEWLESKIEEAEHELARAEISLRDEEDRANSRTEWVRTLRGLPA